MEKTLSLENSNIKSLKELVSLYTPDEISSYHRINLSHNEITSLDGIEEINVKYIDLEYNKIEILKEWVSESIRDLNLSHNNIHTIEQSFYFRGSELNLSHNNIKKLNGKFNIKTRIDLSYNPLDKNFIHNGYKKLNFIATNTPVSDDYHYTKTVDMSLVKKYEDDFYTIIIPKGTALFRWVKNIEDIAESYIGYNASDGSDKIHTNIDTSKPTYIHPHHRVWFYPSPLINTRPFFNMDGVYRSIFVLTQDVECILGLYPAPYFVSNHNISFDTKFKHSPGKKSTGEKPKFRERFMEECKITNIEYRYPCLKEEILKEHPTIQGICKATHETTNANTSLEMLDYTHYNTLFKTERGGYAVPEISIFPLRKEFRPKNGKDIEFAPGTFNVDWLIENGYMYNFLPLDAIYQTEKTISQYNSPSVKYKNLVDELLYRDEKDGFWKVKDGIMN